MQISLHRVHCFEPLSSNADAKSALEIIDLAMAPQINLRFRTETFHWNRLYLRFNWAFWVRGAFGAGSEISQSVSWGCGSFSIPLFCGPCYGYIRHTDARLVLLLVKRLCPRMLLLLHQGRPYCCRCAPTKIGNEPRAPRESEIFASDAGFFVSPSLLAANNGPAYDVSRAWETLFQLFSHAISERQLIHI